MSSKGTGLSVEEQIFDAFFSRLSDNADLLDELPEKMRRLHESGELIDPSVVAETILEATRKEGAPDAS